MSFTEVQVVEMVEAYKVVAKQAYDERNEVVEALASKFKSTVPAVRGKLVSEGVYVAKEATAKTTNTGKDELVAAFAAVTGKNLKSMQKMTCKDLQDLWDYVVMSSNKKEVE